MKIDFLPSHEIFSWCFLKGNVFCLGFCLLILVLSWTLLFHTTPFNKLCVLRVNLLSSIRTDQPGAKHIYNKKYKIFETKIVHTQHHKQCFHRQTLAVKQITSTILCNIQDNGYLPSSGLFLALNFQRRVQIKKVLIKKGVKQ